MLTYLILFSDFLLTNSLEIRDFQKNYYYSKESDIFNLDTYKYCLHECLLSKCFVFSLSNERNCIIQNYTTAISLIKVNTNHENGKAFWVDSSVTPGK